MIARVLEALLAQDAGALAALRPELRGELAELVDVAIARLELRVPAADSEPARLLLALSGHPGLTLGELAALAGLDDPGPAARRLLADGLVLDRRFGRADCWSRTPRGAQAVQALRDG